MNARLDATRSSGAAAKSASAAFSCSRVTRPSKPTPGPTPPPPAWKLLDQLVAVEAPLDVADQAVGDGVEGELAWDQVDRGCCGAIRCATGWVPLRDDPPTKTGLRASPVVDHGREP